MGNLQPGHVAKNEKNKQKKAHLAEIAKSVAKWPVVKENSADRRDQGQGADLQDKRKVPEDTSEIFEVVIPITSPEAKERRMVSGDRLRQASCPALP